MPVNMGKGNTEKVTKAFDANKTPSRNNFEVVKTLF